MLLARCSSVAVFDAERAGQRVEDWLSHAPEYERCQRLVVYAELPGELPMTYVVAAAKRDGKRLLWPRIVPPGGLQFAAAGGVEQLEVGRYGLREPAVGTPVEPLGGDTLVLVPGVGFDLRGARLGRGGGHWDRTLLDPKGSAIFGVAYEVQVVDQVPVQRHDRPVHALLTEVGIRRFATR